MCLLVFKKYYRSSLIYCSPVILGDLLRATKHCKTGLQVFKGKVNELFRAQRRELQGTKHEIYARVSKFMPYDQPYYLLPANSILQTSIAYNLVQSLTEDEEVKQQRADSALAVSSSANDVPMTESESIVPKHSELDHTLSGFDTAQEA